MENSSGKEETDNRGGKGYQKSEILKKILLCRTATFFIFTGGKKEMLALHIRVASQV